MNYFATMLLTEVKSLEERNADPSPKVKLKRGPKPKSSNHVRSTNEANKAKHHIAIERFRAAMKDEWVATTIIERRLGTGRGCVLPTLNKWADQGIVVRRKKGEEKSWTRCVGYEWRLAA